MRTLYPLLVAIALAMSAMVLAMSGLPAALGGGAPDVTGADQLNRSVDNHSIGAEGAPESSNDGDVVQFIINGLGKLVDFAVFLLTIPVQLNELGMPWYWAYPMGLGTQFLGIVGFAQLAMGRRWN